MAKIAFQITLIIAFVVGSIAYWTALGLLALFIWSIALGYAVCFRLAKASVAFFQVLFASPVRSSKTIRSGSW